MKRIVPALVGLAAALAVAAPVSASPTVVQTFTATVQGTSTTSPTNGVLYIYDNATALHHSRNVEYYDHDGYSKTAVLTSSSRPLGVVLRQEDIENNCGSSGNPGAINPVGGTGISCLPVLHASSPPPFPVTGDLAGRYCRVPAPGFHLPCPNAVHRSEVASGSGGFLTVGDKDHGGLVKVSYYANVAGVDYEVTAILPIGVLVTRIVLLAEIAPPSPHAILVLS